MKLFEIIEQDTEYAPIAGVEFEQVHPAFVNLAQPKKKEKKMCYGQTTQANVTIQTPEKKDNSLQYIKDRAREIYYNKEHEIENAFEDPRPASKTEAEKWLKDGNFRVDIHSQNDAYHYCHFSWGKDKPDFAKMHSLMGDLSTDFTALKDTVSIISDEATRLQALKDFEAKTYV